MFRTPLRNRFGNVITDKDLNLTFSSEKSPDSESPQEHSNNLFMLTLNKVNSQEKLNDEEIKNKTLKDKNYQRDDIYLRAEIELLKNDLENEKEKSENLEEKIKEKEKTIQMLTNHLNEKTLEIRSMKKNISELNTEHMIEKNRFLAELECFQKENEEFHQQLEDFKYSEYQFNVVKQEIVEMYKGKLKKFKEMMKERHEKYKSRENEFEREKSKLSDELSSLVKKFSVLENNIPALKGIIKKEINNKTEIHMSLDEGIFKDKQNEVNKMIEKNYTEKNMSKNLVIALGKENTCIYHN